MKTLIRVLAVLALCGVRAEAQIVGAPVLVPLHGSPQGVTSCLVPDNLTVHTIGTGLCPLISFQTHWDGPGLNPELARLLGQGTTAADELARITGAPSLSLVASHSHIECNLPIFGELGGPITVPCRFQSFHTAGKIALEWDLGQVTSFTMDQPTATQSNAFPVVGNPNGVVVANFHLTFDPSQQYRRDQPDAKIIQDHGWSGMAFSIRTFFDNTDTMDTQMNWPFWSMVNPATPIGPEGEATRINLSTRSTAGGHLDSVSGGWGAHLIEFRFEDLPLFAPIAGPTHVGAAAYTYSTNVPFLTAYHLVCDNDYHNGIVGTEMTFSAALDPVSNEPFNHDIIDALKLSQSPAPAGFPAKVHRCTFVWDEHTDDTPIANPPHPETFIAAHETLMSLIAFDVAVTDNPAGCTPETCSVKPPPVVVVPPTCVPPAVLTNGQCVTPPPPPPPPAPTIVTVTSCQEVTLSNGTVQKQCVHAP